jgi:membrane protein
VDRLKRIKAIRFALDVNTRYGEDGGGHLAASLTYYAFLSLFPLILLAMAAIGFVLAGDPQARAEWGARISDAIPGLGSLVAENLEALVDSRRGASVIGLVGLVVSGTGLTNAAGYALSRVYRHPEVQGFIQKRVWSLTATAGLGLVALAGVVVSSFVGGVRATGAVGVGLSVAATLVSLVLDVVLFAVSYRVLTAGWGPPFSKLWPGALLAGAGWTALKIAGTWFAARTVANASEVYGTFGSVVGALGLMYLAARLFMYGAEMNAVLFADKTEAVALQPGDEVADVDHRQPPP